MSNSAIDLPQYITASTPAPCNSFELRQHASFQRSFSSVNASTSLVASDSIVAESAPVNLWLSLDHVKNDPAGTRNNSFSSSDTFSGDPMIVPCVSQPAAKLNPDIELQGSPTVLTVETGNSSYKPAIEHYGSPTVPSVFRGN